MIKVKKLNKEYHLKHKKIIALSDVTFEFEKGKFYAIMGHSGSGKSTLVHCCGLLDSYDSGDVYINNQNIANLTEVEKARFRNKNIGLVFQSFYLSPKLRAYENVMLPMYLNQEIKPNERKRKAINLLTEFGLENRMEHFPKELSGGEQQRVAIARALANDPDIILADEPTGNLDVENEKYVLQTLKDLAKKGKCIIVVSHNDIVKKYADKILYMNKGKLSENDE